MSRPDDAKRETRPKALLFDLGRVLVGYDWHEALQRLADRLTAVGRPVPTAALVEWMLGSEGPHDRYCLGEIDDAALLAAIHARFDPQRRLDDDWLVQVWCDMFTELPGAMDLVDRLRGQARLALVSNTNALHFERLDGWLRLRGRFDHVSVSHEVHAMKPDAALFEHALRGVATAPAEAWFVDDLPENVEGARRLGLRTHLFTGIQAVRRELAAMGFDVG